MNESIALANQKLAADVILSFEDTLRNISEFGAAMEGLDSKFGSLNTRINSLRNSMKNMNEDASALHKGNLIQDMERQIENAIKNKSLMMDMTGGQYITIGNATTQVIMEKVDSRPPLKIHSVL